MRSVLSLNSKTIDTSIIFWPSFVDMLTSVLMIFLLAYFLQTTLGLEDVEAQILRQSQEQFAGVFTQEFAGEIGQNTVGIRQSLNLIQITFSDRILFQSGEYNLQPNGRAALRRCASIFKKAAKSGYKQIQVEGHTDDQPVTHFGYPRDNWELSAGRAISVVKFFVDETSLDPKLFSATGYSEYQPVDPSPGGRAKNRRIEIRVFFETPSGRK